MKRWLGGGGGEREEGVLSVFDDDIHWIKNNNQSRKILGLISVVLSWGFRRDEPPPYSEEKNTCDKLSRAGEKPLAPRCCQHQAVGSVTFVWTQKQCKRAYSRLKSFSRGFHSVSLLIHCCFQLRPKRSNRWRAECRLVYKYKWLLWSWTFFCFFV